MLNSLPSNSVSKSSAIIRKSELFTAGGTWTKSSKMVGDDVWITCIGGGGSGANISSSAGGGDGGEFTFRFAVDVSATSSETVTLGAAGAAQSGTSNDGNSGGVTSFGALLSVSGGLAGQIDLDADDSGSYTGGARGGTTKASGSSAVAEGRGQDNPCALGGNGGSSSSAAGYLNGGGGGLILDASGTAGGRSATNAVAYGGTGYGAGGGAGRGIGSSGAGAPGAMLIEWMETL